jgi:RNA polymerase sigma factor (sigma-70 family)
VNAPDEKVVTVEDVNELARGYFESKDVEDAEDLAHDIVVKFMETELVTEVTNTEKFVRKLCRHRWIDHVRLSRHRDCPVGDLAEDEWARSKFVQLPLFADEYDVAVAALPPRQREAWTLTALRGGDTALVAKRMRIDEHTVTQHVELAREALGEALGEWC